MSGTKNHFYVDEAGDLTLFDRKGRVLVGTAGVSSFFMVGLAHIPAPAKLTSDLRKLRRELLADPYLARIPSMNPARRKTAVCFHATDDCPEVRREVFRVLGLHDIKVQVAIRRKMELALGLRSRRSHGIRWRADDVYDDLVKRIFRNVLHKGDENLVVVARRGKSDRIEALTGAIRKAQRNFFAAYGRPSDKPTDVRPDVPSNSEGLQAIDYCLWALQRLYERGEDRYFTYMQDKFRLVMDLDDTRNREYGEWYSDANPLTVEKIKPAAG